MTFKLSLYTLYKLISGMLGAAWKIHVSPQTKEILDTFGTFTLQHRGLVAMKVCFPRHQSAVL